MAVQDRLIFFVLLVISSSSFSSSNLERLIKGSSLSVEKSDDFLTSPGGIFSAGFLPVGSNAYCFAIWFAEPLCSNNCTAVWMANRDQPVNGKQSKLSLLHSGNLVLTDAGSFTVWTSNTASLSFMQLSLQDSGNLVLLGLEGDVLWQSFDFPTNTLLPGQLLTKNRGLISSRSQSNQSSGFYSLYFDNDNVLRLLYNGPETSGIYWPDPNVMSWEEGRFSYNSSRIAFLDSWGNFSSTDHFSMVSTDYGTNQMQRRLTIDYDGNVRLYSRKDGRDMWIVSGQFMQEPCLVHGICGPNSMCSYVPTISASGSNRKCSCLPGFKRKDATDWSLGCEPEFNLSCQRSEITFLQLTHVEFYGYDSSFHPNYTLEMCKNICSQSCDCKGFQLKFIKPDHPSNIPYCFPKIKLLNGRRFPNFQGDLYLKVMKTSPASFAAKNQLSELDCSNESIKLLHRTYKKTRKSGTLEFVLWFSCAVGVIEFVSIFLAWCFLANKQHNSGAERQGYHVATGFRKFTYDELKKATQGFTAEIGRGAGGIVYKGILPGHRVAAIKKLYEADQGEPEFRAEFSTIGKLNHMNLIEMWGYCAEGKHRLLVYEYMEHGSLAENLSIKALDWKQRFDIAVGVAKGLAYLHEECLEWVLHCDIKPQNILLDRDFQPKLSDFGLFQTLRRGSNANSRISKIRGTRGYIAPEWVFNQPITSKVDVYSYGMVMLEMVTGRSPTAEAEARRLTAWLTEEMERASRIEHVIDPELHGKYDKLKMEVLVEVALRCVRDNKDDRPSMSQVVEMLLHHENDSSLSVIGPTAF
uniref:Receptor-like serine/threonine-protein kinase n=2 Tax=Rhizophora mucronata TaxID=61149 RepID=A0A2P2MR24_RHIMU